MGQPTDGVASENPAASAAAQSYNNKSHFPYRKEEELLNYGKMLNEKKEMARAINMQYEESKYDFVPKINKMSEKIVQEKTK